MLGLALDVLSKDQILKIRFLIPSLSIGVGSYSVSVAAHDITSHINGNYDWWDKAIMFEIVAPEEFKSVGVCYFPCYAKLY
jgi:lipopolysaccharide transport system ATP-binding protein